MTQYLFKLDYSGETLTTITQETSSPYSSGTTTTTINSTADVEFQFDDEDQPPIAQFLYIYNISNGNYNIGPIPSTTVYGQAVTATNSTSGGNVTTDLLTNFSSGNLKYNLTPSNLGGSQGFPPQNVHAYIMVTFI